MAFNRRLDSTFPGFGVGVRNDASYLQTGLALSGTVQQTFPFPSSGTFSTSFTAGKIRLKIYNGGGTTPAVSDLVVRFTDGTNTIFPCQGVYHPTAAQTLSATLWLEWMFEFVLDVATTAGTGGGSIGQLLASVGGANAGAVLTTMTGTAPTATMDLDFMPLI